LKRKAFERWPLISAAWMRLDSSLPRCQEQLKGPGSPQRTAGAYPDTLQRLLAFQVDPLQAERPRAGALPLPGRAGQMGDWEGPLSSRPRQPGSRLCAASIAGAARTAWAQRIRTAFFSETT
jgi:hypothetical protein